MDKDKLKEQITSIGAWFSSDLLHKIYLLISPDRKDITIFDVTEQKYYETPNRLRDIISSKGKLYSIEFNHKDNCYDITIIVDKEELIYKFIKYQKEVIYE